MTKPASDKQIAYIADLTAETLAYWRKYTGATQRGTAAVMVALTLAMPEPTTSEEASTQIAALKAHGAHGYWKHDGDTAKAQEIHAAIIAALGTDPTTYPDPKADDYIATIEAIVNPPVVVTPETIHTAYHAEYDRLSAEYEASSKAEGVIDRFRDDLTADEQAAIDYNDRLLTEWQSAAAALQAKRVAALAEVEGVPVADIERRYKPVSVVW